MAATSVNSTPKIIVHPSVLTMVDQKVDIIVSGVIPERKITLRARTMDDNKVVFESFADYVANEDGNVLVSSEPSLGGSYTGVESMGLFWSMRADAKVQQDDIRKRDITSPLKVTIDVHSKNDEGECYGERIYGDKLASVTLTRCYIGPGVIRSEEETNGFYGTLFLPPGDGPFPGVIDLWGRPGGIREDRAALLAAHGFATLALGYCGFKDLPQQFGVFDLSYFERAVDWLMAHPKVSSTGVGLVGLSMGGVVALAIASHIPHKIKAVVSISGTNALIGFSLKFGDTTIQGQSISKLAAGYTPYKEFLSKFKVIENEFNGRSSSLIPVEHITCPVLLVYGLDDQLNIQVELMTDEVVQRMEKQGKGSLCRKLALPGTGHFITPCYLPPLRRHYVKTYEDCWLLGGEQVSQAKASEIFWNKSLEFLERNIK